MRRYCLTAVIIVLSTLSLCGQDSLILRSINGLGIALLNNGTLGGKKTAVEFPVNSGKKALNRLSFWVTAIGPGNDTVVIADDVFGSKSGWHYGPASVGSNPKFVSAQDWHHFYEVSSDQVDYHLLHFKEKSYQTPDGIRFWPSDFRVTDFPVVLAPYADADQSGTYKADSGDFPYLPGYQNIFCMAADSSDALLQGASRHRIDRSVIWFSETAGNTPANTLFFRVTLCNREAVKLSNVQISMVPDFALGYPDDNFLSTDVNFSSVICYNSQGGDAVYGNSWPAVSCGWLSREATSSIYFENSADAVVGKPTKLRDFYNLAHGYWKTGKYLSFGSSGVDGSTPARFVYSNGTDQSQGNADWDEVPGSQGRRTAVLSAGGWEIAPGGCTVADGYISIIPDAPDSAKTADFLKGVKQYYENSDWSVGTKIRMIPQKLYVYPNPVVSGSIVYIDDPKPGTAELMDLSGRKIDLISVGVNQYRVSAPPGIYLLKLPDGATGLLQVQ